MSDEDIYGTPTEDIKYTARRVVMGDAVEFVLSRNDVPLAYLRPLGDIRESDWHAFWDLLMQIDAESAIEAQGRPN